MQSPLLKKKIPCPFSVLDKTQTQYLFFAKFVFIIVCQTVKNTHSNWLIKLLDLSNALLVEYLLTARSSMPDISTSVLKQKKYNLTCDDDV
jgi:hypothetical protein